MTQGEVKQWFDAILESKDSFNKLQEMYSVDGIIGSESMQRRIHMFKGIEKISEIMDIPLNKGIFECDEVKMDRFFFMYRGAEVFQLGRSEDK